MGPPFSLFLSPSNCVVQHVLLVWYMFHLVLCFCNFHYIWKYVWICNVFVSVCNACVAIEWLDYCPQHSELVCLGEYCESSKTLPDLLSSPYIPSLPTGPWMKAFSSKTVFFKSAHKRKRTRCDCFGHHFVLLFGRIVINSATDDPSIWLM